MKPGLLFQDLLSSRTLVNVGTSLPWAKIGLRLWALVRSAWERLTVQGMYEALDYASTLELLDVAGKRARFSKRQRVRYLQNNIIAYQDSMWSDGEAPLQYKVTPGRVADRYRPGQITVLLISLRGQRSKGETDTFRVRWQIRNGFGRRQELWQTTFYFPTRMATVRIIFPRNRPPLEFWGTRQSDQKRYALASSFKQQLEDGRWMLTWRIRSPRTLEGYNLHWRW